MFEKILKNTKILTVLLSIVVFLIILLFTWIFSWLDKSLTDTFYWKNISKDLRVSNNIVLVWIDDKSVLSDELWRFPFSRDKYVKLVENLNAQWATVIWFDIIFADKSDEDKDNIFSEGIKNAGNIVLGWSFMNSKKWPMFEEPLEKFSSWAINLGFFRPIINKDNWKVYSINAEVTLNNENINHFSISLLKAYYYKLFNNKDFLDYKKEDKNYYYITPDLKVPYHNLKNKELNINYIEDYKFPFYSFIDVYNNNFDQNKNIFKDKIVIIWATASWIKDIFYTPNGSNNGVKYWVYTHANMVNTILTWDYKIYLNKNLEKALLFFLIILSIYVNLNVSGRSLLISNLAIVWSFTLLIIFIILILKSVPNYLSQFIFSIIITLTISNLLKSFIEDKNKTRLNKALSQYVSEDIAEEILHWKWKINLNGERKEVSIFFSDIEWFTTISEKMNPEELVIFLREYLWAMSNIIMDEKWFIDKYEWDAIMALWWVFGYESSSTYDNCLSALKQQQKLKVLNINWKERFWEELKIRMWLNTWEAIIWNIGADWRKMEFTALWDPVNLASRLEEVNKKYWTYLCVSENIYNSQKEKFEFRYLDKIRVKWKNIPVSIYELISIKWEISDFKKDIILKFENAIELYLNKEFYKALEIFKELVLLWDNPSKTYITRCEIFIEKKPKDNWDWVWTMKTK